jgi:hypothetical protein
MDPRSKSADMRCSDAVVARTAFMRSESCSKNVVILSKALTRGLIGETFQFLQYASFCITFLPVSFYKK